MKMLAYVGIAGVASFALAAALVALKPEPAAKVADHFLVQCFAPDGTSFVNEETDSVYIENSGVTYIELSSGKPVHVLSAPCVVYEIEE